MLALATASAWDDPSASEAAAAAEAWTLPHQAASTEQPSGAQPPPTAGVRDQRDAVAPTSSDLSDASGTSSSSLNARTEPAPAAASLTRQQRREQAYLAAATAAASVAVDGEAVTSRLHVLAEQREAAPSPSASLSSPSQLSLAAGASGSEAAAQPSDGRQAEPVQQAQAHSSAEAADEVPPLEMEDSQVRCLRVSQGYATHDAHVHVGVTAVWSCWPTSQELKRRIFPPEVVQALDASNAARLEEIRDQWGTLLRCAAWQAPFGPARSAWPQTQAQPLAAWPGCRGVLAGRWSSATGGGSRRCPSTRGCWTRTPTRSSRLTRRPFSGTPCAAPPCAPWPTTARRG